jgi:hypothetical protein
MPPSPAGLVIGCENSDQFSKGQQLKDHFINKLRECACVKNKMQTWVSELTDDQLYELFLRLRNEESAKSIASRIQKVWGIRPTSTIHSLSQGILKFKRRISHLLRASPPTAEDDGFFPADAYDGLGTLEELEKIAELQRERIKRMMLEEKEMGVKHSNLSRDLQSHAILSKLIMKQKESEIAHQLDDPVRMKRLQVAGKRMNTKFMKMMRDVIPTERDKEKVIRATERFIELIDERSLKLEDYKRGIGNK